MILNFDKILYIKQGEWYYKIVFFLPTDVVAPGTADSSGDYYALHHDSGAWTIKEYGTKENAYSLCQFISKRS